MFPGTFNMALAVSAVTAGINWALGTEQSKVQPDDHANNDDFGVGGRIAMDEYGERAIGVARFEDPSGVSNAGSAYVFSRSGTTWSQEAKLVASDKQADDELISCSISADGTYAIAGARYEDTNGNSAGKLYVFKRSGTTWSQETLFQSSDIASGDLFGGSSDIDGTGTRIVASSWQEDPSGVSNAGSAYVFRRDGSDWTNRVQEQKLVASDKQTDDYFGLNSRISRDGTRIVVGAHGEDAGGSKAGAAYVFSRSGTTWSQEQKLTASDAQTEGRFGLDVGIDANGERIIVAAYLEDAGGTDTGAAYIFKRSGTTWSQEAKLASTDLAAGDRFGSSVGISYDGVYAIVGATKQDGGGTDAGAAYIFKRSGTTWSQVKKLIGSDTVAGDEVGTAVGMSGNGEYASIASRNHDNGAGAAYMFSGIT